MFFVMIKKTVKKKEISKTWFSGYLCSCTLVIPKAVVRSHGIKEKSEE